MKNILVLFISVCFIFKANAQQQNSTKKPIEVSIKVFGNCTECKARIENACDVKGIKEAIWNIDTKMLKVVYLPEKITLEQIHALVTSVGHDTEKLKAPDSVYYAMPDCCLYRENPNTHHD